MWRAVLFALVFIGVGAILAQEPEEPHKFAPLVAPHHMVFDMDMTDELGEIADSATIEHVRCLIGIIEGDTGYVDWAVEPKSVEASAVAARFTGCPLATLVEWHNHLPYEFDMEGQSRTPVPPLSVCRLSPIDARQLLEARAPYSLISVNREVSCLFVRAQKADSTQVIMSVPFAPPPRDLDNRK